MIVLFTDFGLDGPYAGQMKAAPPQIGPGITVIRTLATCWLTTGVRPFGTPLEIVS